MRQIQWKLFGKGMIIGATMIVPGVSGGTMAMILGIYDRLIIAAGECLKRPKDHLPFLITFSLGAIPGLVLFSAPMSWLLEHWRTPTLYFFIGAVLGGIPLIGKKSGIQKVGPDVVLYMIAGVVTVLLISSFSGSFLQLSTAGFPGEFVQLLLSGAISAVALILPGISFSHFLLVLGLYGQLLESVRTMDVRFLFPLAVGVLTGILLFAKVLEALLERFPKQTYLIILGFVIGSVAQIFPGITFSMDMLFSIPAAILGFFLTFWKS